MALTTSSLKLVAWKLKETPKIRRIINMSPLRSIGSKEYQRKESLGKEYRREESLRDIHGGGESVGSMAGRVSSLLAMKLVRITLFNIIKTGGRESPSFVVNSGRMTFFNIVEAGGSESSPFAATHVSTGGEESSLFSR